MAQTAAAFLGAASVSRLLTDVLDARRSYAGFRHGLGGTRGASVTSRRSHIGVQYVFF